MKARAINWRELRVYEADWGTADDTLRFLGTIPEWLAENGDSAADVTVEANGEIGDWPQHCIKAPSEAQADWNTPRVPVDWTGCKAAFEAAIAKAKAEGKS